MRSIFRNLCFVIALTIGSFAFASNLCAQDQGGGGGNVGGGNFGGGGTDIFGGGTTGITNPGTTGLNTGVTGGTGGGTGAGGNALSGAIDASAFDPNNQIQIQPPEDTRREIPFVGPATGNIFNYFEGVGSVSGGGTNFGGGIGGGIGAGGLGGGPGQFGNQFGQFGGGTGNGFTISRRSIRAPLVAAFTSPVVTGAQVSERFSDRLVRIPSIEKLGGAENVRVTVSDGTAVISGIVKSLEARDKVARMAKLEPGIYKVVNQLQVQQ